MGFFSFHETYYRAGAAAVHPAGSRWWSRAIAAHSPLMLKATDEEVLGRALAEMAAMKNIF